MSKAQWIKENLKTDEKYAGIILGKNGEPDYHLILLPGQGNTGMPWAIAKAFCTEIGGELPTRREQSLLFANLKEEFDAAWYWSSTQHASNSGCAWSQGFDCGTQDYVTNGFKLRARAVRKVYFGSEQS